MGQGSLRKYLWLIDTVRRYGRISRTRISQLWEASALGNGEPMPKRTFFNYRDAIAELFDIDIKCDTRTYEYYIDHDSENMGAVTEWLLNTTAVNDILANSRKVSDRIFVEDVPSARQYLAPAIDALGQNKLLRFKYLPYYRTRAAEVTLEPYFLKIFRQRWYLTGRNTDENKVKTYALDRMDSVVILGQTFEPDPAFDPAEYFRYSFGIVSSQAEPVRIAVRTDPQQAKYFRALPLHPSQDEAVHDKFSIFYYNMRITGDLVAELLSYGPRIEVLQPPQLRAIMRQELSKALDQYK